MKTKQTFKIGELAKLCDMSAEAIRFYESKGLIEASGRMPNGYRVFEKQDLDKLRFIKRAQSVGFSLAEISELLQLRLYPDQHSCGEVKEVTAAKLSQIQQKINELQNIQHSLSLMHTACCGGAESAEHCSILEILNSKGEL